MHLLDLPAVMNSKNCAHMLFEENANEHGFDAYMDKIEELDAYLCRNNRPLDPNGLFVALLVIHSILATT